MLAEDVSPTYPLTIHFPNRTDSETKVLEALSDAHPKIRVLVGGDTGLNIVGDDPFVEPAQRLLDLGVLMRALGPNTPLLKRTDFTKPRKYSLAAVSFINMFRFEQHHIDDLVSTTSYLNGLTAYECGNTDFMLKKLKIAGFNVSNLQIAGSDLSNDAMEELEAFAPLKILNVLNTDVSKDAVMAFRKARPDVHLTSDFGTFEPTIFGGEMASESK